VSENSQTLDADKRDRGSDGSMAAALSNAIVSHFADYLGRGPTRARTSLGRDVITVVLEETLTKAERRLTREGEEDTVLTTRRVFQRTMRTDMVESVERITGRRVSAFMSDQSVTPDIAVEVFVLEPQRATAAEPAEAARTADFDRAR
jgi:uncharacterized protein YbcI